MNEKMPLKTLLNTKNNDKKFKRKRIMYKIIRGVLYYAHLTDFYLGRFLKWTFYKIPPNKDIDIMNTTKYVCWVLLKFK